MSVLFRPLAITSSGVQSSSIGILKEYRGRNIRASSTEPISQDHDKRPIDSQGGLLLLEGDVFSVSNDGISRTSYNLAPPFPQNQKNSVALAIEEYYDLNNASKRFVLRHHAMETEQNNVDQFIRKEDFGIAPLGEETLGCLEIQEIGQKEMLRSAGTGATTWEASIAMGLFFTSNPDLMRGDVVELGCGVGFGQIFSQLGRKLAGEYGPTEVKSVTLTDGNNQVLDQCRKNLHWALSMISHSGTTRSEKLPPFFVETLRWDMVNTEQKKYDTVIACDVAYLESQIDPLVHAMTTLLKEKGMIHMFGPYNRVALQEVCRNLKEEKHFDVKTEFIRLERYRLKPYSGSKETYNNSYESKSTATFLHVTAQRVGAEMVDKENSRPMNDVD